MRARVMGAMAVSLVLLAACGGGQEEGGLTAEESRQLNEAAAMLDEAPDDLTVPDEIELGNVASNEAGAATAANVAEINAR